MDTIATELHRPQSPSKYGRRMTAIRSIMRLFGAICLLFLLPQSTSAQRPDRYTDARESMVSEFIAAEGIDNEQVLAAMRTVPRHEFVRPSLQAQAYFDQALDIGHKQTISPPYIVAYMTQTLDPQPDDRVLEIGTGSGYQAAVLSGLVKEV